MPHYHPADVGGELINRVPAGERDIDIYRVGDVLQAYVSGVPGTDVLEEIPEQVLTFNGYLVPLGLSIKEANRVVERNPELRAEGYVVGVCRWQVTMCGEVVYGAQAASSREGILAAAGTMQRLVEQMERTGVRWWDPANWRGRMVWYQGVACRILDTTPQEGRMFLVPELVNGEPYLHFPPLPVEAETDREMPRTFGGLYVDILDPSVGWQRTRTPEAATGTDERDAQAGPDHTVMVPSEGGPDGGPSSTSQDANVDPTETPPGDDGASGEGPPDGSDTRPEVEHDERGSDGAGGGTPAAEQAGSEG